MTEPELTQALDAFESLPEDEAAASLGLRRGELRTRVFAAREAVAADHGLVFRGCRPIRAELAVAPDGVARRERLRRHVLACPGCAAWAEEVERQRDMSRVVSDGRQTTLRHHSRVRRGAAAVLVSAVAATGGYLGVGALQGGAPTAPEAPVAAAASTPEPTKKRRERPARRTRSATAAASPAPVTASSLPPTQPTQEPSVATAPKAPKKAKKLKRDQAATAGGFATAPQQTGGIVAVEAPDR